MKRNAANPKSEFRNSIVFRISTFVLRVLALASFLLPLTSAHAGYVFPFRIISGNTTAEVDETQFSTSDITLSLTNLPGGGRRAIIDIIGGGGGGGSNNTVLVAGNGLDFTDLSGGTNQLNIDGSIVVTNGGFLINGQSLTNGGSITISVNGGGITNFLDSAGGAYSLVGHTNQPTLLIKGLSNATPATLTITDFGTFLGFSVASQGGFGSTNAWTTNGLPWAVSDTFGFSNASSVVGLAFTNLGGVPTIYLVPDSAIARTGQSQTWSAPQTFNSSAILTLGAPTWFKASTTVSDNVTIVSNTTVGGSLTVAGNATISGNMNAGSFTGSMNGANITGNQSIGTNTLAVFGSNTGTIGSAGQFLVVHLNSAGIPDGWSTVTGNSLATSTNSISAVQLGGSWNNGVIAMSISNLSVATINGTTATVGFASAPLENITVLNGTTNFTLHGSSLTISNLLSKYGVTLTNTGAGQIDLGGTVTMLSNSAGAFNQMTGSSASSTQNWSGSTVTVVTIPTSGSPLKFIPNGAENGIQSEAWIVPQDGSNAGYLYLTRNGPRSGAQFIAFNDSTGGTVFVGQEPNGNATGDKRNLNVSTTTSVGGLIVVNQDANTTVLNGYQFYENDPRFPRILFTNAKSAANTNTPEAHETYASFGNWTNSGGSATLSGGTLIVIGSNEFWLVAAGRSTGSVSGTKAKEYPTNAISGILAYSLTGAQSNVTSLVLRSEDNTPRAASLLTNQPSCFQINLTNDFHDTFRVFPNLIVNNGSASVTVFGLNFADTNYVAVASFDFAAGSYTWSAKTTTSITFNVAAPGVDSHADVILKSR